VGKARHRDDTDLLDAFARQAVWCREPAPFSARVLERSRLWLTGTSSAQAEAAAALAAAAPDPLAAAVALRWLAGLHHLALLGLQPWAGLWPPAAAPLSDDALDTALDDAIAAAWAQQRPHLQAALARPPQTNEVQRSAALLPGLLHVAAQIGRPLALAEIGASAGLNLWCDQYRHDPGGWAWGPPASALTLQVDWRGPPPPLQAPLQIVRRAGCDAAPVDLAQPGEALRLASFVWADQRGRLARLHAAQQVAVACSAAQGVVVQAARAADFLRRQLQQRRPGEALVLMHSVVWQYIAAEEQADIGAQMQAAGLQADAASPLAWLRFEPPAADQAAELRCRLWRGRADDGTDRLLARCHPHGSRIDWLAS